jgi:hypothetical protein
MKRLWWLPIFFSFLCALTACSDNSNFRKGLYRGIYEGSTQHQQMKEVGESPVLPKETPTYDQYEQERKSLKDRDTDKD